MWVRKFMRARKTSQIYILIGFVILTWTYRTKLSTFNAYLEEQIEDKVQTKQAMELAVNYLDQNLYTHHPIISTLDMSFRRSRKGCILEPNGLLVPEVFDCANLNNNTFWGSHSYFREIPSRWFACWNHFAAVKSNSPFQKPVLPLIDEEYHESVAVWDAAWKSSKKIVVAEFGARWGTWAFRGVMHARHVRKDIRHDVLLVELNNIHCEGARKVAIINNIQIHLLCKKAEPATFLTWAKRNKWIDLIDMDMQSAEEDFFSDKRVAKIFNSKVKRAIIVTHTQEIHYKVRSIFSDWIFQHEVTPSRDINCSRLIRKRGNDWKIYQENLTTILRNGCYHTTVFGKVSNDDGQLILDNPNMGYVKQLFESR